MWLRSLGLTLVFLGVSLSDGPSGGVKQASADARVIITQPRGDRPGLRARLSVAIQHPRVSR